MEIILRMNPTTINGQDKMVIHVQNAKRGNLYVQGCGKKVHSGNKVGKYLLDSTSNNAEHALRNNLIKGGNQPKMNNTNGDKGLWQTRA